MGSEHPRPDPATWWDHAACRGANPDLFVPVSDTEISRLARRTCNECPVKADCLDHALNTPGVHGIYGGLTDHERRNLRRRIRRQTTTNGATP